MTDAALKSLVQLEPWGRTLADAKAEAERLEADGARGDRVYCTECLRPTQHQIYGVVDSLGMCPLCLYLVATEPAPNPEAS